MGKILDLDASREGLFQWTKYHKERKKEETERDVIYADNRKPEKSNGK